MFLPVNLALASLASVGMLHVPAHFEQSRHEIPTSPPTIERTNTPFATVKTNMLSRIEQALERVEDRITHVKTNEKLSDKQREQRLEHLNNHQQHITQIQSRVRSADEFNDLKEIHEKPSRREMREHRNDMRELHRSRTNIK